ncbi:MAG: ABC transporter permease [Clostridia bacterium]|nr:ABC transporter permease [Clostridia bacterium]
MSEIKKNTVREPLFHLAKRSSIHPAAAWGIRLAAVVIGFILCGAAAFAMIEKLQQNPGKIVDFYESFIKGINTSNKSFLENRKLWAFFKETAILLCISLAVTPAFKMRFWNTGAEGQTLMGVLGAIGVAFYLKDSVPGWALLLLMLVGALVCGAVWAVIPALFKAKWNTNETLFTLMMNYVATFLVSYFLVIWVPSGSSSLGKLDIQKLPVIPVSKTSSINDSFLITLIVLILTGLLFVYLKYSKQGYEISVVGESVRTAQYSGINVKKVIIRTMLVSGLLCGVAGYLIGAGLDQSVTTESVGGQGFTAIMVSWLAKFNPLVMILTSALITVLGAGAEQITKTFNVRGALPDVFVGIILFCIIGSEFFINYQIIFRKKAVDGEKEAVK